MDTFTVRLPRWPLLLRLLGRDPLVRTSDRVEALMLVLAVAVSLLCAPIAAAVGTAVYYANRQLYAEQAQNRRSLPATVTGDPASQQVLRTITFTAPARWSMAGAEHAGTVKASSTAKTGDSIEIWVDHNGSPVPAPTPTTRAGVDAVVAAVAIWVTVIAAGATLFAITRAVCDRIRFTAWQHDLDSLVGDGGGRTTNQP
ncbi:MAG TPA: hypothetical protein VFH65_24455 [Mycobacterium sp.]|nr:hypothetical protein [Mycobacterium sp.]